MSEKARDKSDGHGKRHGGGHHGHGGGSHEEHEGAPEWLISFADMVMLMMGFFVILFALNAVPAGRKPGGAGHDQTQREGAEGSEPDMIDFAIAVREAFNNPVDINSTNPNDADLIRRILQRAGKSEARDEGVKGSDSDVQSIRPSDYYAISGLVSFGEGSSDLNASSLATIREVAEKLRGMRVIVEVRGHVSSAEAARGPEYAMRLSSDRAMAVARSLAAQGVDWWQMRLILASDHDRLEAHPTSRDADRANARVEIVVTDQVVPDRVPTRYGSTAMAQ